MRAGSACRSMLLAVVACATLTAPARATCDAGTTITAGALPAARHTVHCLLDKARAAHGLPPLRRSARLETGATAHSQDMVAAGYFGHDSPTAGGLADRAGVTGYTRFGAAWTLGEDLGWGTDPMTPATIVGGWLASPPHLANVLSPVFRDVGIGLAIGTPAGVAGLTYTADFGRRPVR